MVIILGGLTTLLHIYFHFLWLLNILKSRMMILNLLNLFCFIGWEVKFFIQIRHFFNHNRIVWINKNRFHRYIFRRRQGNVRFCIETPSLILKLSMINKLVTKINDWYWHVIFSLFANWLPSTLFSCLRKFYNWVYWLKKLLL